MCDNTIISATLSLRFFYRLTSEISKELSLPQSSTFNLAATLLDEGYLQQDAVKRYRLGAKLIQVGILYG
nr:helix-turn-helix domain-containing protein [Bacillus paralicheniformis]